MNQATLRSTSIATAINVGIHLLLWLVLLAVMIFYVPSRQKIFEDFKYKIPYTTEVILSLSNWLTEFWILFGPFLVFVLLIVDAPVYFLFRLGPRTRTASRLWSGLMILLPLAALGITLLALWLPYVKVLEGLSK
jgi:type II secretory pathway component PulF